MESFCWLVGVAFVLVSISKYFNQPQSQSATCNGFYRTTGPGGGRLPSGLIILLSIWRIQGITIYWGIHTDRESERASQCIQDIGIHLIRWKRGRHMCSSFNCVLHIRILHIRIIHIFLCLEWPSVFVQQCIVLPNGMAVVEQSLY